jgi:hypothetical protein
LQGDPVEVRKPKVAKKKTCASPSEQTRLAGGKASSTSESNSLPAKSLQGPNAEVSGMKGMVEGNFLYIAFLF